MERIVNLHIEKLPEGLYLATSDDVRGLVAQGRTISETLEIARDVAKKLLEAQADGNEAPRLEVVSDAFDYPLIVSGSWKACRHSLPGHREASQAVRLRVSPPGRWKP